MKKNINGKILFIFYLTALSAIFSNIAYAAELPLYIGDQNYPIKQNTLILDSNDTGGDVILKFGDTLNERIYWDANGGDTTGIFDITDSVYVNDKLSVGIANPISILHVYENTANTDATAGLTVENDDTGDAVMQFVLTGLQRWVIGIDNSDLDKFKIARTADLNTDAVLTINIAGNMGVGTTDPTAKLEVEVSDTNNVPGILIDNNDTTNDTAGLQIDMAENGGAPVLISPLSAAPNTTSEGSIYYDSDTDLIYVYANGSWQSMNSSASMLWEDGTNGVFENDEAVIVGNDAAFLYVGTPGIGDLKIADDFESGDDGYIGGDLVVGALTSAAETIGSAGFSNGGDDLFVAGLIGAEGNIFTDADLYLQSDVDTTGAGDVTLNFGGTNTETMLWSAANDRFELSDDIYTAASVILDGGLTITDAGFTDTNGNMSFTATNDGFRYILGGGAGDDFIVDTSVFTVESDNDRVGINTTAPAYPLDVVGDSRIGWNGSSTRIKLLPGDFTISDMSSDLMIGTTNGAYVYENGGNGVDPLAYVQIPVGYRATNVLVYGSDGTNTIDVYANDISNGTTATGLGSGNIDTELNITDMDYSATNYLSIYVSLGANDQIHGGYVTISPIP